ncbi:homocysteine biosynthesis protein [Methanocaldococcus indicus]|uniref:homocysteine biosynthesis protein n=1 Tax=Methanocaldococcus indicus TaxID=213231 RepID=UPI003C6CF062
MKTIKQINEKIKKGEAVVVTAEEMIKIVEEEGAKKAAEYVDVVTTGTFGAMCSSGVFLNFGHADPPIKMLNIYLNNVLAYGGLAAVDTYIGAAQPNEDPDIDIDYGGAHVIEDLVRGKEIELYAEGYTTDCYPRKEINIRITLDDVNQAIMLNPRNCYQTYAAATNSREEKIYTYMGVLLPEFGNIHYSGAGQLNPLQNDYNPKTNSYNTIGIGTKIFLGGGVGYIVGEGTQHNPPFGTLMVKGNLKEISDKFLRAATMPMYGPTLYIGLGIPIPVLNEEIAKRCAIRDEDIEVPIYDYGVPRRERPLIGKTTYKDLRSGKICLEVEIDNKKVLKEIKTGSVSSYKKAKEVAEELKKWILEGKFLLTERVAPLGKGECKPMKSDVILVRDIMTKPAITAKPHISIEEASRILMKYDINHLPIVDENGILLGIVTSWDIAKAIALGKKSIDEIMTINVITAKETDPVEIVAKKMEKYSISGIPVVDKNNRVVGIVTSEDLSRLIGR